MSTLGDVLAALTDVAGALLDGWTPYTGFALSVVPPAVIVGVPTDVAYGVGPRGRAMYTVPITGAVDVADAMTLLDFLSRDGFAEAIQGAKADAWFGGLRVVEAGGTRTAPNGDGTVLAADVIVELMA